MSEVETPLSRFTVAREPYMAQHRHPQPEKREPCAGTGHHVFHSLGTFGVVEHPPATRCVCGERLIGETLEYWIEARHVYEEGIQVGYLLISLATERT